MKAIYKKIFAVLLCTLTAAGALPQVQTGGVVRKRADVDRRKEKTANAPSVRAHKFYESKSAQDSQLEYMREIYRALDLTKAKNAPLYYPEETVGDHGNLLRTILGAVVNDGLPAYEFLDGREIFTDEYRIKVGEMLDRFGIYHTKAKGSTERNPRYNIEEADYPTTQVLTYYILERWEYDRLTSKMRTRVEAICPVITRTGEFGGEARYPMFWVKYDALRPYLTSRFVFIDDDNNVPRYSLDDYFTRTMYDGEIYKTRNLRNLSMSQMYPDEDMRRQAQDSIDNRLRSFRKDIWVPTRDEYLAQRELEQARKEALESGDSIPGRTVVTASAAGRKSKAGSKRRTVVRKRALRSAKASAVDRDQVNPEASKSVKRRKK